MNERRFDYHAASIPEQIEQFKKDMLKEQMVEEMVKNGVFVDANGIKNTIEDVDMNNLPCIKQIKTSEAWIKLHTRSIKTISTTQTSYGLKHIVENWGEFLNTNFNTDIFAYYVSNGAFIIAAQNMGYSPYRIKNSLNARFRMKIKYSSYNIQINRYK